MAKTKVPKSAAAIHEEQRVAHLVFGRPAPKVSKRIRKRGGGGGKAALDPAIEAAVEAREAWSHKANGTPETHAHAAIARKRQGALARLHASGAIDAHQLAAAEGIALAHKAIVAPVAVRTAKWGARGSVSHGGATKEAMGRILAERAYDRWRAAAGVDAAMLLAIIVDDLALTEAARRWRHSVRSARAILIEALDRWRRG